MNPVLPTPVSVVSEGAQAQGQESTAGDLPGGFEMLLAQPGKQNVSILEPSRVVDDAKGETSSSNVPKANGLSASIGTVDVSSIYLVPFQALQVIPAAQVPAGNDGGVVTSEPSNESAALPVPENAVAVNGQTATKPNNLLVENSLAQPAKQNLSIPEQPLVVDDSGENASSSDEPKATDPLASAGTVDVSSIYSVRFQPLQAIPVAQVSTKNDDRDGAASWAQLNEGAALAGLEKANVADGERVMTTNNPLIKKVSVLSAGAQSDENVGSKMDVLPGDWDCDVDQETGGAIPSGYVADKNRSPSMPALDVAVGAAPSLSAPVVEGALGGTVDEKKTQALKRGVSVGIKSGGGFLNKALSENFAATVPPASVVAGVEKIGEAANIAADGPVTETRTEPSTSKDAESSTPDIILPRSGMSAAMQGDPMPAVYAQPEKMGSSANKVVSAVLADAKASTDSGAATEADNRQHGALTGSALPMPSLSIPMATQDAGRGATIAPPEPSTNAGNSQQIAALVDHTVDIAGKMRSDGKSHVELQVRLHDGQQVTIQLRMNAGEVQPVFKTDSADLRSALEQHWEQFNAASGDRGVRIAAPVFEPGQSGMGDSQHRQQQSSGQQSAFWGDEDSPLPVPLKTSPETSSRGETAPSSAASLLSLFA